MSTRRNLFIRAVASVTGDLAAGFAAASVCTWIIQVAALGLMLSFLLWLLALIAYLAFSQYVLHPAVAILLSDQKLDDGITVTVDTLRAGAAVARQAWAWAQTLGMAHRPAG
ncbi:MAG TPA: hypothetical protein PK306_23945 [Aquabacterium sp.]|nr:hypothetical protein [Aquabacterium sp.]